MPQDAVLNPVRKALWRLKVRRARKMRHIFKVHPQKIVAYHLQKEGRIEYARWLHPGESKKTIITQWLVDRLKAYIKPGDTVLDIGAHTGDTAIPLAVAAGPEGCVLALEPNPYVFEVLKTNASLNAGKTSIIPLNFAATTEDGEFTFHYIDASFINGGDVSRLQNPSAQGLYPLRVTGRHLGRYLRAECAQRLGRLSFIKTDTEGHELEVLLSIQDLIMQHRPVIRAEVMDRLSEAEAVALYDGLAGMGYRLFEYLETSDHLCGPPVARVDVFRAETYDLLALPQPAGLPTPGL